MELLAFVDAASLRQSSQGEVTVEGVLKDAFGLLGPATSSIKYKLADLSWGQNLADRLSLPGCTQKARELRLSLSQLQQSLERRRLSLYTLASSTSMRALLAEPGERRDQTCCCVLDWPLGHNTAALCWELSSTQFFSNVPLVSVHALPACRTTRAGQHLQPAVWLPCCGGLPVCRRYAPKYITHGHVK